MPKQTVISSMKEVTETISRIVKKKEKDGGINRIYCLACGGSLASLYPLDYLVRNESTHLNVRSITANEFVYATPKGVDKNTLAIAMSMGGNTAETVEAARVAKELGAELLVLCIKHGVPLEEHADNVLVYGSELDLDFGRGNQAILLQVGFELLRHYDEYPYYEQAMEGMGRIQKVCETALKKLEKRTLAFGEEYQDAPVIYTIGSGASYMTAYMQTICMFMEMEWIHSGCIHAGDYFHGPFEITDPETPFMIFINSGRTRFLDERALTFLKRYGKKITVVDASELGINTIDDNVVEYFNPILLWCAALEYTKGLAVYKKHPLMMRRYMYKVEY